MTTGNRVPRRTIFRQCKSAAPYPLPSCNCEVLDKDAHLKKCTNVLEKEDWEDAVCSVCLECPHNAVLLLCSSHDKGCRPYMCATSYRYSNCLDQYQKAYKKALSPDHGQPWEGSANYSSVGSGTDWPAQKCEGMELACPLCRGQVKGWTVVEAARKYLDSKKRTCVQDNCSFVGTYKELRKHVKQEHPSAQPREVDPILEQKWRSLEHETERNDVLSTIRSSMPGAMVLGDYVIETNRHNFDSDEEGAEEDGESYEMNVDGRNLLNALFLWQAIGQGRNGRLNARIRRETSPTTAASSGADIPEGGDHMSSLSHQLRRRLLGPRRPVRRRRRNQQ